MPFYMPDEFIEEIMPYPSWRALTAAVAMPLALIGNASADPSSAKPSLAGTDPANPAAAASSFQYESVFKSYRKADEEETSPSKAWRAANEEVARIGGHAGYMKAESQATQASPETSPKGHGSHHGMHH